MLLFRNTRILQHFLKKSQGFFCKRCAGRVRSEKVSGSEGLTSLPLKGRVGVVMGTGVEVERVKLISGLFDLREKSTKF